MNWDKFWLWYDIFMAVFLLVTAAFAALCDWLVRLDGWCAIVCSVCAVLQWHRIRSKEGERK